ncbi:two-component system response regulator [Saccharospirillum sp. MSK14-1]|uniref:response regulator n=1 Tax=Saccharospirillum sp. MSK14-1 TaxID=1897632 RepID=UPI000D388D25|nr:response regulator [Saccharospirillum sp. MSK14-1]PTY37556.1 two-component system response regulator [Saccharospirillum sp. MSK14-1]
MRHLKLLIVEDDPQIAEIQRRFVERLGNVELAGIAHNLTDAEDLVDVLQPDLMLLDVFFPDGNGLDLLRRLRARNGHTDIILITAAREVETLRSALHGGVFDYILKPLVYERLEEAIYNYRQHRDRLDNLERVAQKEVDALLPRAHNETGNEPERLPKGIDALTLDTIRKVLQEDGNWSADAVGQRIGASRTTARRYLEYLVSAGELIAEVNYGSVGRPERRYRLLPKDPA